MLWSGMYHLLTLHKPYYFLLLLNSSFKYNYNPKMNNNKYKLKNKSFTTDYKVYVWPVAGGATITYKNVKISKA